MPALVAASKGDPPAVKLVASTGFSPGQRCDLILVRSDAPRFRSPAEATAWLDGKRFVTPRGSCADRFLATLVRAGRMHPGTIDNAPIDQIVEKLRAREVDAAVLWEPTASRIGDLVGEGIARVALTGRSFEERDAGAIAMRSDFLASSLEVARAWLRAELEAQRFILDPAHATEVARIVASQAKGISPAVAWFSLYGRIPATDGGSPVRDVKPFVFDTRMRDFLADAYRFLHEARLVGPAQLAAGAIDDSLARQVASEAAAPFPLGLINATSVARMPHELREQAPR
jgi:NitT/TauT family transport system substrate-binding protein